MEEVADLCAQTVVLHRELPPHESSWIEMGPLISLAVLELPEPLLECLLESDWAAERFFGRIDRLERAEYDEQQVIWEVRAAYVMLIEAASLHRAGHIGIELFRRRFAGFALLCLHCWGPVPEAAFVRQPELIPA